MSATKLSVVVDQGAGTSATVVITIPAQLLSGDPDGAALSLAQSVQRGGFWDDAHANFYPPASIRKITPA